MLTDLDRERDAIAHLCRRHGVRRLTAFGSAVTDAFDPVRSDVDLLVEFDPALTVGRCEAYFDLKGGLEAVLGRPVDLVDPSALDNPYFAATVAESSVEIYAP